MVGRRTVALVVDHRTAGHSLEAQDQVAMVASRSVATVRLVSRLTITILLLITTYTLPLDTPFPKRDFNSYFDGTSKCL